MRQAVMTEPGKILLHEVEAPIAGPGEILLRVKKIGVCGSDIHVWHGLHPFTPYPVVQGHEFSAVVEAVGDGVTKAAPGMKATAAPQKVCGVCNPCKRGDYHICDELTVCGFQAPGCAQELFVAPEERVVVFGDSLTFEQAVEWIAEGLMVTEPLITSHFPFDKFAEAYQYIEEQGETTLKVVIDVD